MPLPNPGMSFTPFDPLPAADLNNIVENVEGLQDWSAYDADTLPANLIDFASNAGSSNGGIWWEEIGRTTLSVAGDSISVASLPARKYLRIQANYFSTGGTTDANIRFNNDSSSNYSVLFSAVGTSPATTSTSQTSLIITGATTITNQFIYADLINVSSREKIISYHRMEASTAGAGTAPNYSIFVGKWANTAAQISRIDILNLAGTGDFAIGSELIVLGHN